MELHPIRGAKAGCTIRSAIVAPVAPSRQRISRSPLAPCQMTNLRSVPCFAEAREEACSVFRIGDDPRLHAKTLPSLRSQQEGRNPRGRANDVPRKGCVAGCALRATVV